MILDIQLNDYEFDLIEADNVLFFSIYRVDGGIGIYTKRNYSEKTFRKFIIIQLDDIRDFEHEYRERYPTIVRKHKIKKLLNTHREL